MGYLALQIFPKPNDQIYPSYVGDPLLLLRLIRSWVGRWVGRSASPNIDQNQSLLIYILFVLSCSMWEEKEEDNGGGVSSRLTNLECETRLAPHPPSYNCTNSLILDFKFWPNMESSPSLSCLTFYVIHVKQNVQFCHQACHTWGGFNPRLNTQFQDIHTPR